MIRILTARGEIGDSRSTVPDASYDWIGYPTFNIRPGFYSGCEGQRTIPGVAWHSPDPDGSWYYSQGAGKGWGVLTEPERERDIRWKNEYLRSPGLLDDGAQILRVVMRCRCGVAFKHFEARGGSPEVHCPCGQVHRIDWPAVAASISFAQVTPATSQPSGPGAGGTRAV